MNTVKTFETDCHTVIDRSDINLKGLKYKIDFNEDAMGFGQKLLYICESKETMSKILGELCEWAFDGSDHIIFSEHDFLDYSEYNPFELDRREKAIAKLSVEHPNCASIHPIIKSLIPTIALEALAENGFQDCSWGNDECPSFYKPSFESMAIYIHDDVNDEGQRISMEIKYAVFVDSEYVDRYSTIEEALEVANG
tara:strand:- start:392 stop:979 length:588 start_codon:yes stop_codon:yes gene_type:complete